MSALSELSAEQEGGELQAGLGERPLVRRVHDEPDVIERPGVLRNLRPKRELCSIGKIFVSLRGAQGCKSKFAERLSIKYADACAFTNQKHVSDMS